MFWTWARGLGLELGTASILAMGVEEAPGRPLADDFKVTCSPQPTARPWGLLVFVGMWVGGGRASVHLILGLSAVALGRLRASPLVGGTRGFLAYDIKVICSSGGITMT